MKISIVTAVFNSAGTIEDTIQSVLRQNYSNREHIIIDAESADGTLEIIRRYEHAFSYWESAPDRGISDGFNRGIRKATGDYVGIVSADDFLLPGALTAVARFVEGQPNVDVICGNVLLRDDSSGEVTRMRVGNLKRLPSRFVVPHAGVFVRRRSYLEHGLFDLALKCAMDYDIILRLFNAGATFSVMDQDLAVVRMGGANQRLRARTRREVRAVSLRHGCPRWQAEYEYLRKRVEDPLKPVLAQTAMRGLVRRLRGRVEEVDPKLARRWFAQLPATVVAKP